MAKGQKRSSKEIRKPKKDKSKEPAAAPTFGAQMKKAQDSGVSGKAK